MLARLDEIEDVRESRVDWSGRFVLLTLEEGADEVRAVRDAAAIVGEGSRRLRPDLEAERVEGYRRGEPWMRANETLRLSREEARIIAQREGAEAAKEAGLSEAKARRLIALIEEEVAAAFERVERGEGSVEGKLGKELRAAERRSLERSRDFLSKEEVDRVARALPRQ